VVYGYPWRRDESRSFGGGTGRIGRSESGHDDGDDSGALGRGAGSTGMKEKEVGVVSDCNTTPSSDWLIPLSHCLICKEVVGSTEVAAPNSVKVANVALSICGAEVEVSAFIAGGGGVSLPHTAMAPGELSSGLPVPTKVALLGDQAISLHHVVLFARLTGANASTLGTFSRLWGLGRGTVHPIIWRIGGGARCTGWGERGTVGHDRRVIFPTGEEVGIGGVEGIP
jgi:hypothetical protein